jgi:hypothetical protein
MIAVLTQQCANLASLVIVIDRQSPSTRALVLTANGTATMLRFEHLVPLFESHPELTHQLRSDPRFWTCRVPLFPYFAPTIPARTDNPTFSSPLLHSEMLRRSRETNFAFATGFY